MLNLILLYFSHTVEDVPRAICSLSNSNCLDVYSINSVVRIVVVVKSHHPTSI